MKTMETIWKTVATEFGTTPQEVREEICKAIAIAKCSDDPHARSHWDKLCEQNPTPSPEEVLLYLCTLAKQALT